MSNTLKQVLTSDQTPQTYQKKEQSCHEFPSLIPDCGTEDLRGLMEPSMSVSVSGSLQGFWYCRIILGYWIFVHVYLTKEWVYNIITWYKSHRRTKKCSLCHMCDQSYRESPSDCHIAAGSLQTLRGGAGAVWCTVSLSVQLQVSFCRDSKGTMWCWSQIP